MKKHLLAALSILLAVSFTAAQKPQPSPTVAKEDDEVVRISTTLIQIDVTATDKSGKIVTDLRPDEIEIYENGEKQKITNFSFISNIRKSVEPEKNEKTKDEVPLPGTKLRREQVRRTIALVVDDLSLSFTSTAYVRGALKKFVEEQMEEGDLVAIIRTGAGIGALQQFTSDKRLLYAAIEKVRWNPIGNGGISPFAPIESQVPEMSGALEADAPAGLDMETELNNLRESIFATGTLGAVNYVIRGMQELPGRKAIMMLSDGFPLFTRSPDGLPESSLILESMRRLIDAANRASVVIYTMDARGLVYTGLTAADNTAGRTPNQIGLAISNRRDRLLETQQSLTYLAKQTGGFSIVNNNSILKGIQRVLDDQSYYIVGYDPDADTFDLKKRRFNKLEVKVLRKGVNVRFRSGFFGLTDERMAAVPAVRNSYRQIYDALTSPFAVNDISVRLNTLFINEPTGQVVRSLLHIDAGDLKFEDTPEGLRKAVFDVLAVSFGDNGVPVNQIGRNYTLTIPKEGEKRLLETGFVYHFAFPVKKPGSFQYRVAIQDKQAGRVGSASQFIEIPNLKKERLTISGIVLENLTPEQWKAVNESATVVKGDPMTDTSLRRFRNGTVLRYAFDIYNAKLDASKRPQVKTRIRVLRDGKLLLEGADTALNMTRQTDVTRLKGQGAIDLTSRLQPGEYVLQVIVTDELAKEKRRIATQFVEFEVEQ